MKRTRLISKILYVITLVIASAYFSTTLYAICCKLLDVNIQLVNTQNIIEYPFTDTPFLILDNTWDYWVFSFLLPILFYSLFFLFLSSVFKVFFQQRLFTTSNITHLKRFYFHNLIAPIVFVIIASFFIDIDIPACIIVLLHIFLGVFVFIISEIFSQGINLQDEQDLYI